MRIVHTNKTRKRSLLTSTNRTAVAMLPPAFHTVAHWVHLLPQRLSVVTRQRPAFTHYTGRLQLGGDKSQPGSSDAGEPTRARAARAVAACS